MSDNKTLLPPRTSEGHPPEDNLTMYNIQPNLDLNEESPPASQGIELNIHVSECNAIQNFPKGEISAMKRHVQQQFNSALTCMCF